MTARTFDDARAEVTAIVPPACPDWCEMPAGHRYDGCDLYDLGRGHEAHISHDVTIDQWEYRDSDGVVTLKDAGVFVFIDMGSGPGTPGEAFKLARDLIEAASKANEINGRK